MAIADWVEPRVALDTPVNIHLTGCPHSCAQHYIGDIGLLACRVAIDAAGEDTVEGFHVFVGGGFGADAGIGRELYRDVKVRGLPAAHRAHPPGLRAHRAGAEETFLAFTRRHEVPALKAMVETIAGGGAAHRRRPSPAGEGGGGMQTSAVGPDPAPPPRGRG